MRSAKGIVHVDIREPGECLGKFQIVCGFLGMEAKVLEQQDLACGQLIDSGRHLVTDAILREMNFCGVCLREGGADGRCNRFEGHRRIALAFRTAEMRGQDDARIGRQQSLEGWQRGPDSAVIADLAVFLGHIEIRPDEYALSIEGNGVDQGV